MQSHVLDSTSVDVKHPAEVTNAFLHCSCVFTVARFWIALSYIPFERTGAIVALALECHRDINAPKRGLQNRDVLQIGLILSENWPVQENIIVRLVLHCCCVAVCLILYCWCKCSNAALREGCMPGFLCLYCQAQGLGGICPTLVENIHIFPCNVPRYFDIIRFSLVLYVTLFFFGKSSWTTSMQSD